MEQRRRHCAKAGTAYPVVSFLSETVSSEIFLRRTGFLRRTDCAVRVDLAEERERSLSSESLAGGFAAIGDRSPVVQTQDPEMKALVEVLDALGPLGDAARLRVLHIARDFFDLPALPVGEADNAEPASSPAPDPTREDLPRCKSD